MHGVGKYVSHTDNIYTGEWVYGVRQGKGVELTSDGLSMMANGIKTKDMAMGSFATRMESGEKVFGRTGSTTNGWGHYVLAVQRVGVHFDVTNILNTHP